MPIIHAELWKGFSPEAKKALAKALTNAMVQSIDCPVEAVTVVLNEIEKEDWYIGAKNCKELFPDLNPER